MEAIPTDLLNRYLEFDTKFVQALIENDHPAGIAPMIVVRTSEDTVINSVEGPLFDDHDNKCILMDAIGNSMKGETVLTVTLISECWVRTLDEGAPIPSTRVKNQPGRLEAVAITARSIDGRTGSNIYRMMRQDFVEDQGPIEFITEYALTPFSDNKSEHQDMDILDWFWNGYFRGIAENAKLPTKRFAAPKASPEQKSAIHEAVKDLLKDQ